MAASPNCIWGFPFSTQQTGTLYGGVPAFTAESAANTGSTPGCGYRMGTRKYANDPSTVFATSGAADTVAHNEGVRMCTSVSSPSLSGFTYAAATNGSSVQTANDAAYNALFARMGTGGSSVSLKWSQAVTASGVGATYGGFTWPDFELIIQHEVDNPNHQSWGNAAAYQTYLRHIHNLAVAAGVRSHIKINLCIMAFGIPLGRCDQYIAGVTDIVDILGIDVYNDFTKSWAYDGSTSSFATAFAPSLAFIRKYNLPFNMPEFSEAESGNDTDMQNWFTGVGTTLTASANSDVTCVGVYMWAQTSSAYQNSNKLASQDPATGTAHAGKHAGIIASIAAMGGNTNPGATITTVPSAPTTMHVISYSTDGTSVTVGWDATPTWTPSVANLRVYIGNGITTSLHNVGGNLSVATSYTFTGLTPGGTQYTVAATWENSVGNSGYGTVDGVNLLSFVTATPGVTIHAPNITNATVTTDLVVNTEVDMVCLATDPQGQTLSYAWVLTDPNGVTSTYTGASATSVPLSVAGNWSFAVAVTNTSLLTTSQTGFFNVVLSTNTVTTKYLSWGKPQSGPNGTLARGLGPLLRAFMDDLDVRLHTLIYAKGSDSGTGLVAKSFEPQACHSTNTQTLTSGWAYWHAVTMKDDSFGEIWFMLRTHQVGTGTQVAIYDSNYAQLPNGIYSGTYVDGIFQNSATDSTAICINFANNGWVREANRTPGETLYIVVQNEAASTPPTLSVGSGLAFAAKLGDLGQSAPAWGGWNLGNNPLPAVLPVGSWTSQDSVWCGLG